MELLSTGATMLESMLFRVAPRGGSDGAYSHPAKSSSTCSPARLEVWLDELECYVLQRRGQLLVREHPRPPLVQPVEGEPCCCGSTRRRHSKPFIPIPLSLIPGTPEVSIPLTLLIVYSIALTAVGLGVARRVRGSGDFFVAGRRLTCAAAVLDGARRQHRGRHHGRGRRASRWQQGVSAWWWERRGRPRVAGLAFWIGPRIRRLAAATGSTRPATSSSSGYGPRVRGVVASLIWLGTLAILAVAVDRRGGGAECRGRTSTARLVRRSAAWR